MRFALLSVAVVAERMKLIDGVLQDEDARDVLREGRVCTIACHCKIAGLGFGDLEDLLTWETLLTTGWLEAGAIV